MPRQVVLTKAATYLLFLLATALFLWNVWQYFNIVEDDAFIPFRYALQFWRGNGWVMNPGEHTEGCTSPLHLFLVTILSAFLRPDTALFFLKGMGVVIGLTVLWRMRSLMETANPDDFGGIIGAIASVLLASRPEFAMGMTNCLETGLIMLFVLEMVLAVIHSSEGSIKAVYRAVFFAGCAVWTRPEALLLFPVLVFITTGFSLSRTILLRYFLPYCASVAGVLLYRLLCYGALLPNTYYAKQIPFPYAFPGGIDYFLTYGMPLGGAIGLLLFVFALVWFLCSKTPQATVLAVPIFYYLGFALLSGGNWMADGRYVAPALPFCFVVWGYAAGTWGLSLRPKILSYAATVGIAIAIVWLAGQDNSEREERIRKWPHILNLPALLSSTNGVTQYGLHPWRCTYPEGRMQYCQWLDRVRPTRGTLIAISEMGLVPLLYPDLNFLDLRGLTDAFIAHSSAPHSMVGVDSATWANEDSDIGKYLKRRAPEWVAVFDGKTDHPVGTTLDNGYLVDSHFQIVGDHGEIWYLEICRHSGKTRK